MGTTKPKNQSKPCASCKEQLELDDIFCIFCGSKQEPKQPSPSSSSSTVEKPNAPNVKKKEKMECPNCKVELAEDGNYCVICDYSPGDELDRSGRDTVILKKRNSNNKMKDDEIDTDAELRQSMNIKTISQDEKQPTQKTTSQQPPAKNSSASSTPKQQQAASATSAAGKNTQPRNSNATTTTTTTTAANASKKKTPPPPPAAAAGRNPQTPSNPTTIARSNNSSMLENDAVAALDKLWVPDDFSQNCMSCSTVFGLFPKPRRHHCRVCGLLFCRNCLKTKILVPSSFGYGTTPQKCCGSCAKNISNQSIKTPQDVFKSRRLENGSSFSQSNSFHDRSSFQSSCGDRSSCDDFDQLPSQNSFSTMDNYYDIIGVRKDANANTILEVSNAKIQKLEYTLLQSAGDTKKGSISSNNSSSSKVMSVRTELDQIHVAAKVLLDAKSRHQYDKQLSASTKEGKARFIAHEKALQDGQIEKQNPANTARSMQNECQICFRPFNKLKRRQHHCRRCTRSVCASCSEGSKPIPEFGFLMDVRHCNSCYSNPKPFARLALNARSSSVCEENTPPTSNSSGNSDPNTDSSNNNMLRNNKSKLLPAGYEYLSELEIQIRLKSIPTVEDELYEVGVNYTLPHNTSITNNNILKEIAKFQLKIRRTYSDVEWLNTKLCELAHAKSLPFFPSNKVVKKGERDKRRKSLEVYIQACCTHRSLQDSDIVCAFLSLNEKDWNQFQSNGSLIEYHSFSSPNINSRGSNLTQWLQYKLEENAIQDRLTTLKMEHRHHEIRMANQDERKKVYAERVAKQAERRLQSSHRAAVLAKRETDQLDRKKIELQRLMASRQSSCILYFDMAPDAATRESDIRQRKQEKAEFEASQEMFDEDTDLWNEDMAEWSQHRAEWMKDTEQLNSSQFSKKSIKKSKKKNIHPDEQKDNKENEGGNKENGDRTISDVILSHYSILSNGLDGNSAKSAMVEKKLQKMYAELSKLKADQPFFLQKEGAELDAEWCLLSEERNHWTKDRALIAEEETNWLKEDESFEEELEIVKETQVIREYKERAIERDLESLQEEISTRAKIISRRASRYSAFLTNLEENWVSNQKLRSVRTNERLAAHKQRLSDASKRLGVLESQVSSQRSCERVLSFASSQNSAEQERSTALEVFRQHEHDSKLCLRAASNMRAVLPEHVLRLEADVKICQEDLKCISNSNHEIIEEAYDPLDDYMSKVKSKREAMDVVLKKQTDLVTEQHELIREKLLSVLAVLRVDLEKEIGVYTTEEEALILEFKTKLESELKLGEEEEKLKEAKEQNYMAIVQKTESWSEQALSSHSLRKKNEATRLVEQAQRGVKLQTLVQHFTQRSISQENRLMSQQKRIRESSHRVEKVTTDKNWYKYINIYNSRQHQSDLKKMEEGKIQREQDVKVAHFLLSKDEENIKKVRELIEACNQCQIEEEKYRKEWSKIEKIYDMTANKDMEDEDAAFSHQIRDCLSSLAESFESLKMQLKDEQNALETAEFQLTNEIESIGNFIKRMETEEDALIANENNSLAKEAQVLRSERDAIDTRARALANKYKKIHELHTQTLPSDIIKVESQHKSRGKILCKLDEKSFGEVTALFKNNKFYDQVACEQFYEKYIRNNATSSNKTMIVTTNAAAKNVGAATSDKPAQEEMQEQSTEKTVKDYDELREIMEWYLSQLQTKLYYNESWIAENQEDKQLLAGIKSAIEEIDWPNDVLSKIPSTKQLENQPKVIDRKMSVASSVVSSISGSKDVTAKGKDQDLPEDISPAVQPVTHLNEGGRVSKVSEEEEWLVDLLVLKDSIMLEDTEKLAKIEEVVSTYNKEEAKVVKVCEVMRRQQDFMLSSLRIIDERESKESTKKNMRRVQIDVEKRKAVAAGASTQS